MGRAAGDSTHYTFVLYDESAGKYRKDVKLRLPSSTTIVKQTLANPMLIGWAYRHTRDVVAGLIHVLGQEGIADEVVLDVLSDGDWLEEYLKENGLRPDDVRDRRAEEGKREHAVLERLCELSIRDPEDATMYAKKGYQKAQGSELAIHRFWLDHTPWAREAEKVLPHMREGYCGTTDFVWEGEDDGLEVTDLKTRREGLYAYESDWFQVDSYDLAYEEIERVRPARRSILLAFTDGQYELVPVTFERGAFLRLKAVWDVMQGVDWTGRKGK